jgi:hypothetical protein
MSSGTCDRNNEKRNVIREVTTRILFVDGNIPK